MPAIPKCDSCGQPMIEVCELGTSETYINDDGKIIGVHSKSLYQCPECKDIKAD